MMNYLSSLFGVQHPQHNEQVHSYTPVPGQVTEHHAPLIPNPLHEDDKTVMMSGYTFAPYVHPSHMAKAQLDVKLTPISGCFFTLANTIMGAGTLGLPFALAHTGFVLGSILLCLSALSSSFALHLLSLCALKLPYPSSFYKVAATALPHSEKLIDLAVVIKCFGVATSYLIVIGGLMPDAMQDIFGESTQSDAKDFFVSRMTWVTAGFFIVIPLSFFSQLGALRYTSFMSLSFIFFLMIIVILFACNIAGFDPCSDNDDNSTMLSSSSPSLSSSSSGSFATTVHRLLTENTLAHYFQRILTTTQLMSSADDDGQCVGEQVDIQFNTKTMKVLSIFIFGFTCHQNMFTIVNELQAVTVQRCNKVILYAVGTAVCVYLIIANCGYSTYGDKVKSNILVSYPKVPIVSVVRCFVSLLVSFTYPLQCNPARKCLMTLLASIFKDEEKPPGSLEHAIFVRYIIVTVLFLGCSYAIALSVTDLGVMLSLVGATGSTLVSYILPGFSYYFLFQDEGPAWKRNVALFQGCLGLALIPVCLTFIFYGE